MAITRKRGDTSANRRRQAMRSCAEVLRLLALRQQVDTEARDMIAFLAFNLRIIYQTIEESAAAWDDRNYWRKAEKLRHQWRWSKQTAQKLEQLLINQQWEDIPPVLISLIPYFEHITIDRLTRNSDWWCGAYSALLRKLT